MCPRHHFWTFPFVLALVILISGCSRSGSGELADDVKVDFTLGPKPLKVGTARATVILTDKEGKPVKDASVKLEGNMNHAGMKPEFAEAKEVEPGKYEADLELTMGGDWFVLIDAKLSDGRKVKQRKIDVPNVKSE